MIKKMLSKKTLTVLITSLIMFQMIGTNFVIASNPSLQVTFTTSSAQVAPGSEGFIQMTLENTGTETATKVKIMKVNSGQYITTSGIWFLELGSVGGGDVTISALKFLVDDDAPPGVYTINFEIRYCADMSCTTINPNAIVTVHNLNPVELISIEPNTLNISEITTLEFTILNNGESTVKNMVFTWTSDENEILPLGTDNKVFIKSIGAGKTEKVLIDVIVGPTVVPGVHSLNINLEYSDQSGSQQNMSSIAGILVSGMTDFDVGVQDSTAGSTTFFIANIGANTGYSVVMSLPEQDGYRMSGASDYVMGNLDSGDYTFASFQINQNDKDIPLTVTLSYTDELGIRRTLQKEVFLSSSSNIADQYMQDQGTHNQNNRRSGQTSSSNTGLYLGVGLLGIVAIVLLFIYRTRKRKKQKK